MESLKFVVVMMIAVPLLTTADERTPGEPAEKTTQPQAEAPAPSKPSVRDLFLESAQVIPLRAPTAEVERITAALGKPDISFTWCNSAGCVNDVPEARATRMSALWVKTDEVHSYGFFVSFCRLDGEWLVADIRMSEKPVKPGAWGTSPKSTSLFTNTDRDFFLGKC